VVLQNLEGGRGGHPGRPVRPRVAAPIAHVGHDIPAEMLEALGIPAALLLALVRPDQQQPAASELGRRQHLRPAAAHVVDVRLRPPFLPFSPHYGPWTGALFASIPVA
jgi:hypothetical protein